MHIFCFYLPLRFVIVLLSILLSACMVGPNFKSPAPPPVSRYTEKPMPAKTVHTRHAGLAGKTQYFIATEDIPRDWWTLFRSPALDYLIRMGLANSPNLAAAEAALRQAQETLHAQTGALMYPNISGTIAASRQKTSGAPFGDTTTIPTTVFSLYNPSLTLTYTLDVFGGNRRQLEALRSQVDYQRYLLEAAYLTLTANIVTMAIQAASFDKQIQATHELIRSQEEQLHVVEKQFQLGGVSSADVLSQQSQLAQTRASLPPLEKSLAQSRHALAVLVGTFPSQQVVPDFDLDKLSLPQKLPVSLPSLLVQQRPDIRAAEALLHKASAQIGVATANLLPQINLTANIGSLANKISALFTPAATTWLIGGQLTQPIFNGGSLRALRRAAIAAYQQAAAQYKQTVLQAFQNVADVLRALELDAKTLQAQQQAESSSQAALAITQKQFRLGGVSYLALLTAQRQYQQAKINRIQAQAARYSDTAALFQALGGGWW